MPTSQRVVNRPDRAPAVSQPVARVVIDSPLPHLDRPFDYLVPESLADDVGVGSRVRVRFAGRLTDAWVLERRDLSDHEGRLAAIERVLGTVPVLTTETVALFRAIADRWAGTFADVLRLAVPPRHARAEAAVMQAALSDPVTVAAVAAGPRSSDGPETPASGWSNYRAGPSFESAVVAGKSARAVWNAVPGEDWPTRIAELAAHCHAANRGVILVVPDVGDIARVDRALSDVLPANSHVVLSAELGPETRYRRWLSVRLGRCNIVVGNRSAVFAPVQSLGLVVVWDDGDDSLSEQRAPYPHARDVAVLRSSLAGCALLIGGFGRTAESAQLVASGWAHDLVADRAIVRARLPRIVSASDDVGAGRDRAPGSARLPSIAFRVARESLASGKPVLVQVPRRGYQPSLVCAQDRVPARCQRCQGPLGFTQAGATATCRWCGHPAADWHCAVCKGTRLRASTIGSGRTAEEIGRAFPGAITRVSAGDTVLSSIPAGPALVVATPGAEPVAPDGYGAALLLDGWAMLARPDLRSAEETLRRWMNAVALVVPGGSVVVGADAALPVVQALLRWDAPGFAARELSERAELGLPPTARWAALSGRRSDVADLLARATLPADVAELGTTEIVDGKHPDEVRTLLRATRSQGLVLAEALHSAAASRSAKKSGEAVRIMLDPRQLL